MSTRTTYHFVGGEYDPSINFYIHYDGYLEGGACYFHLMLDAINRRTDTGRAVRGGYAAAFLVGNADVAEFTEGHDAHGDTEYTYTFYGIDRLVVRAREGYEFVPPENWPIVYEGGVCEFVNKYAGGMLDEEDYSEWRITPAEHGGMAPMRRSDAEAAAAALTAKADDWIARGVMTEDAVNVRSVRKAAAAMLDAWADVDTEAEVSA